MRKSHRTFVALVCLFACSHGAPSFLYAKTLGHDKIKDRDRIINSGGTGKEKNGVTFLTNFEYLTLSGAADEWAKDVDSLQPFGYSTSHNAPQPYGFRLGALFPYGDKSLWQYGASIGYIEGPSLTYSIQPAPGSSNLFGLNGNFQTRFIRLMVEAYRKVPLTTKMALRIGGGVGGASGHIGTRQTLTISQFSFASGNADKNWFDATWEGSASFLFTIKSFDLELGYKLARFPQFQKADIFRDFKWNPSIFYLAFNF